MRNIGSPESRKRLLLSGVVQSIPLHEVIEKRWKIGVVQSIPLHKVIEKRWKKPIEKLPKQWQVLIRQCHLEKFK